MESVDLGVVFTVVAVIAFFAYQRGKDAVHQERWDEECRKGRVGACMRKPCPHWSPEHIARVNAKWDRKIAKEKKRREAFEAEQDYIWRHGTLPPADWDGQS